jgi:hypothetical protein
VDRGTVSVHGGLTAVAAKTPVGDRERRRCGAWILTVVARGARGG